MSIKSIIGVAAIIAGAILLAIDGTPVDAVLSVVGIVFSLVAAVMLILQGKKKA